MTILDDWRSLRGDDLEQAVLTARWWVHQDDTIGGWCIMPVNLPPSSGYPDVAHFLTESAARHIADLHNATLPPGPPSFVPSGGTIDMDAEQQH